MSEGVDVTKIETVEFKHFYCHKCSYYFQSSDFDGEPSDEDFTYYSICPKCSRDVKEVPHYYKNLKKMSERATGPRTEEGKQRSSINAYKHGGYASLGRNVAPALHNKYPECEECPSEIDCSLKLLKYCPYKLDTVARFLAAYESGNPDALKSFVAIHQAKLNIIISDIMSDVITRGGVIVSPVLSEEEEDESGATTLKQKTYYDEETRQDIKLINVDIHPALKRLPELLRVAGATSEQQQMTPDSSPSKGEDLEKGLQSDAETAGYIAELSANLAELSGKMLIAASKRKADPSYRALEGGGEEGDDSVPINTPSECPFSKD